MTSVDLAIINGTILTMDSQETIINKGTICIKDDIIVKIGTDKECLDINAKKVIDADNCLVMPGLINTHTHASMTCFRGLADDLPLMTWLNDHIFPAEAKLDTNKIYKGALLACAEMIMSGTTCFCDMYLFEDFVAQAASCAGVRAVVGEVLYDFDSPNYGALEKGFEYTKMLIDKWKNDPLISIAVEPHSTYLCAPDLLKKAHDLALKEKSLLVIHVAETVAEVQQIKQNFSLSPVKFLADIGVLSPNLLACHCVHLTDEEIDLLKKFDVKIAHNVESNMKLASGIAPIPKLLEKGICVGLGTDGCASNNDLDMFSEMDFCAKLHKVNSFDPTLLDAKSVVNMATIDGAKALGLDAITGSLEKGKKADLIVIDTMKPHLIPMYNFYSHIVYAAKSSDVITSIINGKIVMENKKLLTIDLESLAKEMKEISKEIMEK